MQKKEWKTINKSVFICGKRKKTFYYKKPNSRSKNRVSCTTQLTN
jgi:hypothetical protein